MSTIRIYVNARGHDVPAGASALDAVQAADPVEAAAVRDGTRLITDSRGIAVAPESAAYAGVIYRIVTQRDRDSEVHA